MFRRPSPSSPGSSSAPAPAPRNAPGRCNGCCSWVCPSSRPHTRQVMLRARRDRDRDHLHRGNRWSAAVLAGRRAPRPTVRAEEGHPGRLRADHRRHAAADRDGPPTPASGPSRPGCSSSAADSGPCSPRPSTWCNAASWKASRARSRASPAASPTSARHSGSAIAGTVLVAGIATTPGRSYALAMAVLAAFGVIGFIAAMMLPRTITTRDEPQPRNHLISPPMP